MWWITWRALLRMWWMTWRAVMTRPYPDMSLPAPCALVARDAAVVAGGGPRAAPPLRRLHDTDLVPASTEYGQTTILLVLVRRNDLTDVNVSASMVKRPYDCFWSGDMTILT